MDSSSTSGSDIQDLFKKYEELRLIMDVRSQTLIDNAVTSSQTLLSEIMKKVQKYFSCVNLIMDMKDKPEIVSNPQIFLFSPSKSSMEAFTQVQKLKEEISNIYEDTKEFAKKTISYCIANPGQCKYFAYNLFPVIFGYFCDRRITKFAAEYLKCLINNDNEEQIPFETLFMFFESFMNGAYSFHDLLWSDFRRRVILKYDSSYSDFIFDFLMESLHVAWTVAPIHVEIFGMMIELNSGESIRLFMENVIKNSFDRHYHWMNHLGIRKVLFDFLQKIDFSPDCDEINKVLEALDINSFIDPLPSITEIPLSDGFIFPIMFNDMILLFSILGFAEKSQNLANMELNPNSFTLISVYITPENKQELKKIIGTPDQEDRLQEILVMAERDNKDPISYIEGLNGDKSEGESNREFSIFVLKKFIREEEIETLKFDSAVQISMIIKDMERFSKVVDCEIFGCNFGMLNGPLGASIKIGTKSAITDFSTFIINTRTKLKNVPDLFYPILVMKLNSGFKSNPRSVDKLMNEYDKIVFPPDNEEEFDDIIRDEINLMRKKIMLLNTTQLGDQLLILSEIGDNFQTIETLLNEANIEFDAIKAFAGILSAKSRRSFVQACATLAQVMETIYILKVLENLEAAHVIENLNKAQLSKIVFGDLHEIIIPKLVLTFLELEEFRNLLSITLADSLKK